MSTPHYPPARVAMVTGGTGGIGRAVALRLAREGDQVLIVGRDPRRGADVLTALRSIRPEQEHAFIAADLSLLTESARAADEVGRRTDRLDAMVFCAGILSVVPEWTSEGLERTFALNYLSRYILTRRLLPLVEGSSSGRLVFVAAAGRYPDSLDFTDLQHRNGRSGLAVAGRTQFANDLLAVELAERLAATRVEVSCVYPGVVATDVFRNARGLPAAVRLLAPLVQRLAAASPEKAATTPAYLARDPGAVGTSGRFFGPNCKRLTVPERALRPDRRDLLWAASSELIRAAGLRVTPL